MTIDAVRRFSESTVIMDVAFGTLWGISGDEAAAVQAVLIPGAVDLIIKSMDVHRKSPKVLHQIAGALLNLSGPSKCKVELAAHGTIEALVCAMRNHEAVANLQEQAAGAIAMLANDPDSKVKMAEIGVIDLIITTIRNHRMTVPTLEMCLAALWNISAGTTGNRLEVVKRGGIDVALLVMTVHPEAKLLQEMGCGFLWTVLGTPEQHRMFMSEAISRVVESAAKRFTDSRYFSLATDALNRKMAPEAEKAIKEGVCLLVHAPRCKKVCDAQRQCFCKDCNVISRVFACISCNGNGNLRYCVSCFQNHHTGHIGVEMFGPISCDTPQK